MDAKRVPDGLDTFRIDGMRRFSAQTTKTPRTQRHVQANEAILGNHNLDRMFLSSRDR